ncbi:MAG TPA: class I SAM-dependent methyltransferase [Candidatus Limnocylindrales bacterium]|nr:class I SAM-dependent methyltransferase [Candidatus Limnocylindrales bacterium]
MEGNSESLPPRTTSDIHDRPLAEYEDRLKFPTEEYKGKTVLDIGSGKELKFARQAAKKGVKVISINPELRSPDIRRNLGHPLKRRVLNKIYHTPQPDERTVAAVGQDLPIRDNSIDAITAVESVPRYLKEEEDIRNAFTEMIRVLKPGGIAYVGYGEKAWNERYINATYESLKKDGHNVTVNETRYYDPRT